MTYVELMKDVKLELAAEYLVMAAILAEIKSRLLLPKQIVDDEEVDPRAELVRRLQEYEVIKKAAQEVDELPRLERDVHIGHAGLADNFKPKVISANVELSELVSALQDIIKRTKAFEHHHIQKETLSTRERMTDILQRLTNTGYDEPFIEFSQLFNLNEGKQGVVVTFLAILELIKESLINCVQAQIYGKIQVILLDDKRVNGHQTNESKANDSE
jgi:segregation and condensation protein A